MNSDSEIEFLNESSSNEDFSSSETESEDDSLDYATDWRKVDVSISESSHSKFSFTGNPGIKVCVDSEDPLDYFKLFFDDEIISFIVMATNEHADSYFKNTVLMPGSRASRWEETDNQEMERFFALLLLQGIVQKPVEQWFWSKRPILSTPFFCEIMTEKRYGLIMKFLYFENNAATDVESESNTKLGKINALHNMLVQRFKSVYVPEQDISIDESLISDKARLGSKQYVSSIKLLQLCELESGYIWNSFIYTGKGTFFHEDYDNFGVSTKRIMTLLHELKDKGYCLITNKYYTSSELADILIKCKTDLCGTLKENSKGLPYLFKTSTVNKGQITAFQKGKICIMKWKDQKTLVMLSTFHNPDMVAMQSKRRKVGMKIKPKVVDFYNRMMSAAVDKSDQCLSYYPVARNQQRKYYKKIFRHLLNQAVWNSFVIYKKKSGTLNHAAFRMKLIERLIEKGRPIPAVRSSQAKGSENVTRLYGRHFPSYVQSSTSKKNTSSSKMCSMYCSKK